MKEKRPKAQSFTMEQTTQTVQNPIIEPRKKRILPRERGERMRKLAVQSPRIGKRGPDKSTLTKEAVMREMQERILARTMKLTNAQSMLGLGTIKVFRIDAHYENFGRVRKLVKEKPVIVTDDEEIINVLDHEYNDGPDPNTYDDEYPKFYFVETKDANNSAIESQLNRVFGKAMEKVDITSAGSKVAPVIIGMRIIDNSNRVVSSEPDKRIIDISDKNGTPKNGE